MLATILSIIIVLLVLLLFFAAVLIFRSTLFGRLPGPVEAMDQDPLQVESALVAEHLAAAIRLQTISNNDPGQMDLAAFDSFQSTLERLYPRLHATLKCEQISRYSWLYTWAGRATELEPVVLMGHMDVVPADPATLAEWTHPPFSGTIADGYVWGRGALDMKSTVISTLEAVEGLIKAGYQPERTLMLAFGHDEEIGGLQGARCIVQTLEKRGIRLAAVLDEGSAVIDGLLPGVALPAALIGIAEKGHASVQLLVEGRPGHASMPSRHTAIGILARAITRLEASPMPIRFNTANLMFADLGAFLPFKQRLALANFWLFGGIVKKQFQSSPTTNAMVRTTMAATMIQGGVKDNVLPAHAGAVINCRILPGDSCEKLIAHIREAVNDEAVQINLPEDSTWEPSPISPIDSPVYLSLSRTIRQVFPDVIVAPFLVTAATDSRYYYSLCDHVYRFSPYVMNSELLKSVHGIDERIPVDDLARMVQFYSQIIKAWTTVVGTAE